jgi:transcriptional regulator with XRE-family HTH domain
VVYMSTYTIPTDTTTVPEWTLSDRLQKARNYAGLTQSELAHQLGAGTKTVIRYENGEAAKRSTLIAWAVVCGVDPQWLIEGNTPATLGGSATAWYGAYGPGPPFDCPAMAA